MGKHKKIQCDLKKLSDCPELLARLRKGGVKIIDPDTVYVEGKIKIGRGSILKPGICLTNVEVGRECLIGPAAEITDSVIGDRAIILFDAQVKRAQIGNDFKMHHRGYLGDAVVGDRVNYAAGATTGNYDGKNKHETVLDNDVFVGIGVNLVAPISIASGCMIAAGSTIPAGEYKEKNKLLISRTKEVAVKPRKKKKK